jgi:hypothetical protein
MSLARSWPKLKTVFLAVLIICTYDWRLKIQLLRWDFDDVFQVLTPCPFALEAIHLSLGGIFLCGCFALHWQI